MRNKKGFTLIELLAVIVIIALITLITIPVVGNIIEKSKKDAFLRSIEGITREYEYKEVQTDTKLGMVNACSLQEECKLQGTVDRNSNNEILVTLSNGKYCGAGILGDITVTEGRCDINLGTANVSDISPVDYDGTAHEPVVEVVLGGVTLVSGSDYIVSYEDNINAGIGKVIITGKGDYKGSITKTFTINRVEAPNSEILGSTLTYNGLSQSLITSVNVSNSNVYYNVGTELNSNNYNTLGSLERPSEINAGTYTVYYYAPASGNYKEIKGSVVSVINKITPIMNLSANSGSYYLGENGTITVTGSNYGTLSCSSSNEAKVTCSVEDSTIVVTPISVGSATLTITGTGTENYSEISKTHSATIKVLPTIDSCPGCVYSLPKGSVMISTSTFSSSVQAQRIITDYTRDYTTLNKYVFYGYILNDNNEIQRLYVCQNFFDYDVAVNKRAVCIEASVAPAYGGNSTDISERYNRNKDILTGVYGASNCRMDNGTYICHVSSSTGEDFVISAGSSGYVSATATINIYYYCEVFTSGGGSCSSRI